MRRVSPLAVGLIVMVVLLGGAAGVLLSSIGQQRSALAPLPITISVPALSGDTSPWATRPLTAPPGDVVVLSPAPLEAGAVGERADGGHEQDERLDNREEPDRR